MALLTGQEIWKRKLLLNMVEKVKCPLSYGLDPTGYTLRLSERFRVPIQRELLDPMKKEESSMAFHDLTADEYVLYPKTFVLGRSVEEFCLPHTTTAIAFTKSSYARLGVFAHITTIDAGFHGYLTISIINIGTNPVVLHSGYGIAEVLFFEHGDTEGYDGNYQNQKGIRV